MATQLANLGDLVKTLDGLKKSVRNQILRRAMNKATRIVAKAAKSNVRVRTGLLKKSIGAKVKVYKNGRVVGIVGPRTGFKKKVVVLGNKGAISGTKKADKLLAGGGVEEMANPTKYSHFVEKGRKGQAAYPFLRPALASTKAAVQSVMAETIRDGLAKAAQGGARGVIASGTGNLAAVVTDGAA